MNLSLIGEGAQAYPFAFIHVSLVAHKYLIDIIRGMLLNVPDPVPYI